MLPDLVQTHGRFKPNGMPRLRQGMAPRGMIRCVPFADSMLNEVFTGKARLAFPGSGYLSLKSTAYGYGAPGFYVNDFANYITYTGASGRFNTEVILVTGSSVANGALSTIGTNGLLDINGGKFRIRLWNGSTFAEAIDTSSVATATYYHVVGVSDGANIILYVNGVAVATTVSASTAPLSPWIVGPSADNTNTTLLFASLSYEAGWTAQEVANRYNAPYDFLIWPDDDFISFLVGASTLVTWGWQYSDMSYKFQKTQTIPYHVGAKP